jgi:hypothetical protein
VVFFEVFPARNLKTLHQANIGNRRSPCQSANVIGPAGTMPEFFEDIAMRIGPA